MNDMTRLPFGMIGLVGQAIIQKRNGGVMRVRFARKVNPVIQSDLK